jgi:hypothetical protein
MKPMMRSEFAMSGPFMQSECRGAAAGAGGVRRLPRRAGPAL